MSDLLLPIEVTSRRRLGIESALRDAVRTHRLAAGARLPSTRVLAAELGVARATVVGAYEQLIAEGYLVANQGGGTRVAPLHDSVDRTATARRTDHGLVVDLVPGEPDRSSFPRAAWMRSAREMLRTGTDELFGYGDTNGLDDLRDALVGYLARTRRVDTEASNVSIVGGVASGLGHLARMFVGFGLTSIAVEDPGFPFHRDVLRRVGLDLVPIPVDDEGIVVDALDRSAARAVLVTPAHQYPLGMVLSAARRAELIGWARTRDAWIVEDDYDGEFRYDRPPIGSLQGLDPSRVVYAGTASKMLAAALRIGWMALPGALVKPFARVRGRDPEVSRLEQATFAVMIANGALDRHVRAMRTVYRRRRDALVASVGALPGGPLELMGIAAGLHLTALLPEGRDEVALVARAAQESMALWGLAQHWAEPRDDRRGGLVLGFSRATSPQFARSVEHLCRLLLS